MIKGNCKQCGKKFQAHAFWAMYCSNACKVLAYFYRHHEKNKERNRAYHKAHRKEMTERRRKWLNSKPWLKHLMNARRRCSDKKLSCYSYYGGNGIKCLLTHAEVKALWDRDKAVSLRKPNIDRINPKGHYAFNNCRFIEHSLNSKLTRAYHSTTVK